MIDVLQLHVGNFLLRVHHHGVRGWVGLLIVVRLLRTHNGFDLELDWQHRLRSDSDHAVSVFIFLKIRTLRDLFLILLPLEHLLLPPLLPSFLLFLPLQPLPLNLRLTLRLAVLVRLILLLSRGKTAVSSSVIPQSGTEIFITAPIIPSMTENTIGVRWRGKAVW